MSSPGGIADPTPLARRKEQRAWYWYDWANSAYITTIGTVLFAPYMISVAEDAAINDRVSLLGIAVAPGSLPSYLITISTIISALMLPLLGAVADRTPRKRVLLGGLAWTGAAFASLLFFCKDGNWEIGAIAIVFGNIFFAASTVVSNSILPLISTPHERDQVSSKGWAWGYLGGALLLAVNLVTVQAHDSFGLDKADAVRLSMLSAVVWWAAFTLIPFFGLKDHPTAHDDDDGAVARSGAQLKQTLREMRHYPVALTFLVSYLFFNDGIQTVIWSASTYGEKQLGFDTSVLIMTILMVQFVAVVGALIFGRLAPRFGTKRVIMGGLFAWMGIVCVALVLPAGKLAPFLAMAVAIGLVMGGTQALARSYFSLFIPEGKEAEFFSFYHIVDRGTSWLGTLVFGLVYQLTDSYRPAILALIAFFIIGAAVLTRVDTQKGIADAQRVRGR